MKWYLRNLRCGLRTAFFFPAPERFVGSWHALMAIAATTVVSQILMELAVDGLGGELSYYSAEYLACLACLALGVAYLVSFFGRPGRPVLEIAVAFLNSYYFIFVPYAFIQIAAAARVYSGGVLPVLQQLIEAWGFLVMFRIASTVCATGLRNLLVAGLLAAGALYLLNAKVGFSRIYYVEAAEDEAPPTALDKLTSEEVFGMQDALRLKSLHAWKTSKPGQTDIYALTLGPYSYQDVFMRDVRFADARLKSQLGITNIISMLNNKETVETTPLADSTNLRFYLKELSQHYMQPKEDIALIFMTSHGSAKDGVAVNLGYRFTQLDISPALLQAMLKDSGIQNRVIIISACYSGVFVPVLKDDNTMIITAAAADRVSFGCSDTNSLTYFTQAYFMDGLSQTNDPEKAFYIARDVVAKREAAMGITEHSNPQIFVGSKIKAALGRYAATHAALPRDQAAEASATQFRKATGREYAAAQPQLELEGDVASAKAWLRATAARWKAHALYGAGGLLFVFAAVVYRLNPGLFRRGGREKTGLSRAIFSPAVRKAYLLCLGIIALVAWLAWCAFIILG